MKIRLKMNDFEGVTLVNCFRLLVLCALTFSISACVSTGEKKNEANASNTSKQGCGLANNNQKSDAVQIQCLPGGIIEITEKYGVNPEVREEFDKAIILLGENKVPEAIQLLKAVSGKTSKFSAPHINLGIVYSQINELKKAEESLTKALEINSQHPAAMNELGLVYRKTGRYKEARKLYEELLSMYPDFMPARKNLGVLCDIYTQDLDCAYKQYQKYLENIPDDGKVKIWVADVKNRM